MSDTYRVERLAGEPILILKNETDYSHEQDKEPMIQEAVEVLDAAERSLYMVMDIRQMSGEVDDIVSGANLVTQGPGRLFSHQNVLKVVAVTDDPIITVVLRWLAANAFGNLLAATFPDPEQALEHVRAEIAAMTS